MGSRSVSGWGSLRWGVDRKQGGGNANSCVGGSAFLEMRVLVRLGEKGPEGRWDEGIFVEEVKGLCPACWGLCTWMVPAAGGGQRKKLGLELKPRPMAGNGSARRRGGSR